MSNQKIVASVIIRTYNEEKYLRDCLNKVFNQKTKFPFEVIAIDSGSTDSTLKIIKDFNIHLKRISPGSFTYGRSLNLGCNMAKGEYLVFLSAHAIPVSCHWLEDLIKNFDDKTAGVFGKHLPMKDANPLVRRFVLETWNNSQSIKYMEFSNVNAAIKKEVWEKNHFNETAIYAEDRLWARIIKKLGYRIKYSKLAVVHHSHNDSLLQFYKRYFRQAYTAIEQDGFLTIFIYFRDICHNAVDDIRYVIANKEGISWIFYSLLENFLKFLACTHATAKQMLKPKHYRH